MKALTLTQPWASLVALGHKRIETRSWAPPKSAVGTRIAIHAGKGLTPVGGRAGLLEIVGRDAFRRALVAPNTTIIDVLARMPFGAIVAVATLVEVGISTWLDAVQTPTVRWSNASEIIEFPESAFGDYMPGRFMWRLSDIAPLPSPLACRGYQMLWDVPSDIEAAIAAQMGGCHDPHS